MIQAIVMQRSLAIFYSLILHTVIFGLLLTSLRSVAFDTSGQTPAVMKIQATVVDEAQIERELERLAQSERDEQARQRAAELQLDAARRQREEEERRLQQLKVQQEREREAALTRQRKEDEQRAQAEAERQARSKREQEERERKAAEENARLAELESQRKAEEERLAELKAEQEAAEKQRQEAAEAERKAELQAELEREQRWLALQQSGLINRYKALIRQKVERNWIEPPGVRTDLECEVHVTQIPGGEVVDVRVGRCNGGATVVRSIEAAVLKASPLPEPPDPDLFERNIVFIFKPGGEG